MADYETEVRRTSSGLREVRVEYTTCLATQLVAQKEEIDVRLAAEQEKSARLAARNVTLPN